MEVGEGERFKVEKGEEGSGRANRRMTAHLGGHSISNSIPQNMWESGDEGPNSGERCQPSEIGYWSLSPKKKKEREKRKKKKRSEEDSTPIGSQDVKQKTKAEVCWQNLCQGRGSKEKSPGMLEDCLQSRKAHSTSNPLMSLALNVHPSWVRMDIKSGLSLPAPERAWERKEVTAQLKTASQGSL